MNNVTLIGRLGNDPEVKYTQSQMAVCKFRIAVNRISEGTDWINIVVFGKTAENCEKFLAKGRLVGVQGRIQTGSYEKDGRKVYTTDVVANRVEFLGGRGDAPLPVKDAVGVDSFEEIDEAVPF